MLSPLPDHQTLGTINTNAFAVNHGDGIVTDELNAGFITVRSGGISGGLITNDPQRNNLSSGTLLSVNFSSSKAT